MAKVCKAMIKSCSLGEQLFSLYIELYGGGAELKYKGDIGF